MSVQNVQAGKIYMGRLPFGSDLLEEITGICLEKDIRLGRVEALGAVQRSVLGFYDQKAREYSYFTLESPMEITKLVGNISVKEGQPMVHAHITLGDEEGRAFGGHLSAGTTVFACEVIIQAFEGPELTRQYDEETGLPLWKMQ